MMTLDIDEIMDRWARWRMNDTVKSLGHGKNFICRMMEMLRKGRCPACLGLGKLPRADYARTKKYKKCDRCKGEGKIKLTFDKDKINPACIHGTGYRVDDSDNDLISERVDRLVAGFKLRERAIVEVEYAGKGTQLYKAHKLRMSLRTYERGLEASKKIIMEDLTSLAER